MWNDLKYNFYYKQGVVARIIIVNVVVFLIYRLLDLIDSLFLISAHTGFYLPEAFENTFSIPASFLKLALKPWTLFTYMFFHEDLLHIFFNMFIFYVFGIILRDFISNKKILPIYIFGGLAGAFLYVIAFNIFPLFYQSTDKAILLGASAGVMSVMAATATLVPTFKIFRFIMGGIEIRYVAIVAFLIDVISIPESNSGGHFAHIGGAIMGFIFMKQLQKGVDWSVGFNHIVDDIVGIFSRKNKKKNLKVKYKKKAKGKVAVNADIDQDDNDAVRQERLDQILDKISQSGYDSLSSEEKEFLFRASKGK